MITLFQTAPLFFSVKYPLLSGGAGGAGGRSSGDDEGIDEGPEGTAKERPEKGE